VIECKNKYNLSIKQAQSLYSIIILGLMFKTLNSENIEYSNGKILSVEGITLGMNSISISDKLYDITTDTGKDYVKRKRILD